MKRFNRLPSIEQLEEKRLKAADLTTCPTVQGPASIEAANLTPSGSTSSSQLRASSLQEASTPKASITAEEAGDDSETENQETDDTDETGDTDQTDDSDDSDETESNDTDNDDTDEQNGDDNDNESNDTDNESDDSDNGEMKFTAALTGTGEGTASVKTDTDDGSAKTDFKLEITGAPASQTFDVTVGTTVVGTVTTDAQGAGKLKLSSDPDDDEQVLPTDFPTVDATTSISVGVTGQTPILTGTFAVSSELNSSAALHVESASSSQTSAPAGLLADESESLATAHKISSPLTANVSGTQNLDEGNVLDQNLLDAGFAAAARSGNSGDQFERPSDDFVDQGAVNESPSLDAAFESLVDGELGWTV